MGIQVVHDLFEVFGQATLGGVLTVTYAQEPLPNAASTWIPVRFTSRNNTQFSTINLPVNFTSTYGNDRLTIEYDPEEEPVGDDEIEIEP